MMLPMATAFSLFSGAGGLDLGFEQAGFRTTLVVETNKDCCSTVSNNLSGDLTIVNGSVEALSFMPDVPSLLHAFFRNSAGDNNFMIPSPDIVIGGPPCQAFSVAGRQDPSDPRGTMVGQFVRIVREVLPKAFVLENVTELLTSKRPLALAARTSVLALQDAGYLVTTHILNAKDFGLPQSRKRVFFIGMRQPLPHLPASSTDRYMLHRRMAGEVLREIGRERRGVVPNARVVPAKNPILRKSPYSGLLFNGKGRVVELVGVSGTLPASMGGNRTPIIDDAELYDGADPWIVGYHYSLMTGGQPATEAPARLRRMTTVEAATFQGFPRDFRFSGNISDHFRQIGNAVPPPMARAIAMAVKEHMGL